MGYNEHKIKHIYSLKVLNMMYPFLQLDDQTEIVHSDIRTDGRVKVYIEKPVEGGFHYSTVHGGFFPNDEHPGGLPPGCSSFRFDVSKNCSLSRYYPQPDLRRLGDVDILVRKQDLDRAKALVTELGYIEHEAEHDFHIGYRRQDAYVELHYHVTRLPDSVGGLATQAIIEHFLDAPQQVSVCGHTFPALQEEHQALSLILHMIRHMFHEGIGLRQLCDWMMFVNANRDCFSETILPVLKGCGLAKYAKTATRTCILFLGLPEIQLEWCLDITDDVCCLFMEEIFRGGNMGRADQESMGSLFTDSNTMGNKNASPIRVMLEKLNSLTYMHFPFVKCWKVLLPFFWVFLPIRYFVRSMLGLRPKKSVVKVVSVAQKQRHLYDELQLFWID